MDLLERYLLQIRRYLPFQERNETIDELRSLILDQLDESDQDDKEQALHDIIKNMGDPRDVALRYVDRGPIISKELEPIMMLVIKITAISLPLVLLFADSIAFVTEETDVTFYDFMLNLIFMIPNALYGMVVAIGMVFIAFALIGRYVQPKFAVEEKVFIPELLPELPRKEFKAPIFNSIIMILANILILYLANFHVDLMAVYTNGTRTPIFTNGIHAYIILLSVGWMINVFLHVYYLYRQRKSRVTKTIEYILALYGAVIILLIATADIYNDLTINGTDLNIVASVIRIILPVVAIIAIIGSTVDYVKMYINLNKLDSIQDIKK